MQKTKVVIGLSGGVDSSVAAALLVEQGYDVQAVYLECYNEPGCRTDQDKADALKVAIKLGIPFEVLDFRKEYKEKVIEYFFGEYKAGRTPNPDIMCNREIKFGIFYDWARQKGFEYIATGHYCRIQEVIQYSSLPVLRLRRARDESKDQSYFLWQIPSDHLSHIIFPLGEMLKSEVRAKARELGLLTASKPDSMGICFIGDIDVHKLLKERLGEDEGDVVIQDLGTSVFQYSGDPVVRYSGIPVIKYQRIGKHKGLWFYTIGQRGGFVIDHKTQKPDMEPLYVIGKNIEKNELIVGERKETMRQVFRMDRSLDYARDEMCVRIRNLGELIPVEKIDGETVYLKEKIFGVAAGQSCVFYDSDGVLVAGSIIV